MIALDNTENILGCVMKLDMSIMGIGCMDIFLDKTSSGYGILDTC